MIYNFYKSNLSDFLQSNGYRRCYLNYIFSLLKFIIVLSKIIVLSNDLIMLLMIASYEKQYKFSIVL